MKTLISFCFSLCVIGLSTEVSARDLTYKFGAGWRQSSTTAHVNKAGTAFEARQLNGLEVSYGVARDLHLGGFFGFLGNFDFAMAGPKFRYELHRLIDRDAAAWKHLHLFTEVAFLAKFGSEAKSGICLHAPYLGIEIYPLADARFAITTAAGLVIDFVEENRVGFTQGLLGDIGIKYYF